MEIKLLQKGVCTSHVVTFAEDRGAEGKGRIAYVCMWLFFVKDIGVPQCTITVILTMIRLARPPEKLIAFPVGQCYDEEEDEGGGGTRRGEEGPVKISPAIEEMILKFFRI